MKNIVYSIIIRRFKISLKNSIFLLDVKLKTTDYKHRSTKKITYETEPKKTFLKTLYKSIQNFKHKYIYPRKK